MPTNPTYFLPVEIKGLKTIYFDKFTDTPQKKCFEKIREAKNKSCFALEGRPIFWKDAQNIWFRRPSDAQQFEVNLGPCHTNMQFVY